MTEPAAPRTAVPEHWARVVERLRAEVVEPLKRRFVGRDEVIDLIALAAVSGEHLFLLGPPGTAKSALIRGFAEAVRCRTFEYLLTRFSEPNELFGPIDLAKLREGTVSTVTRGMLPEAEFAFLDELFNANSAILNNLLTVLNERVYRRGAEVLRLPLISMFSASNQLADDPELRALFDRFLLRCRLDNLPREAMPRLLTAGWELERLEPIQATLELEELRALSALAPRVELSAVHAPYAELVGKARDMGIALSDRRAVKVLKLLAASALLCGRLEARPADLWVLRYVWDREEQIEPLASLVGGTLAEAIDAEPDVPRHSLAKPPERVDPEDLARQLEDLEERLASADAGLLTIARIRERLADLSDQAAWVADESARRVLLERTATLLDRLK